MDLTPRDRVRVHIDEIVIEGGARNGETAARAQSAIISALRERGLSERLASRVGERVAHDVSRSVKP